MRPSPSGPTQNFPAEGAWLQSELMAPVTPMIGRRSDLSTLRRLLRCARLITLTGPAGVGKTRLAIELSREVAGSFRDGVIPVSLAAVAEPDLVMPAIAQALGLVEGRSEHLLRQVQRALREKQVLLLLDNFEHVADAAPQILLLLSDCPRAVALITSREVLGVRGEYVLPVPPLRFPQVKWTGDASPRELLQYPAVALFVALARTRMPTFRLTDANAAQIAALCARLDGLPLAIELATANIDVLPPATMLAELEGAPGRSPLEMLANGYRDTPLRHRGLREAIQWSYNRLRTGERCLLHELSVFAGGCTLEAATAVAPELARSGPAAIAVLIHKNLVRQEAKGESPRLAMLTMVREFGLEKLEHSDEAISLRRAHAAYYLKLVEAAEPGLVGADHRLWLSRLDSEASNLQAAMRWAIDAGEIEVAWRLARALSRFWIMRGLLSEGRYWLRQVCELGQRSSSGQQAPDGRGGPESGRAGALYSAGMLAYYQADCAEAIRQLTESLTLFRTLGYQAGVAAALIGLGRVLQTQGDLAGARRSTEEGLAICQARGDQKGTADAVHALARVALASGQYSSARRLSQQSLAVRRTVGDSWGVISSLRLSSTLALYTGALDEAMGLAHEYLALGGRCGNRSAVAGAQALLGQVLCWQGQHGAARQLFDKALRSLRELGAQQGVAVCLVGLADLALAEHDAASARALFGEGLALAKECGQPQVAAICLDGMAGAALLQGEAAQAAQMLGTAAALRQNSGMPLPPVRQAMFQVQLRTIRSQLGREHLASAWAEGRRIVPTILPQRALVLQPSFRHPQPPTVAPESLTTREAEVLQLVTLGLANAEIAERLVISPRTVHAHLRSIYGKLGVSSRTAAARAALTLSLG